MTDRIDALRAMLAKRPDDARLLFGLAAEYERLERWQDVIDALRAYLGATDDEGNAWGRLALALSNLDRHAEAREALRRGIDVANRHGHPSMAAEFEERLEEMQGEGPASDS